VIVCFLEQTLFWTTLDVEGLFALETFEEEAYY
jgi:hypothetical protein